MASRSPIPGFMLLISGLAVAQVPGELYEVVENDATGHWRHAHFITTHYTEGEGFTPAVGKDPDMRFEEYPKDGHPFDITLKPANNNYHAEVTVYTEISTATYPDQYHYRDGERIDAPNGVPDMLDSADMAVYRAVREISSFQIHVDFLNYDPASEDEDFFLKEHTFPKHYNAQVLNNVIIGNSLFTIIFPPGWYKGGSYPVFLQGLGYGSNLNDQYRNGYIFDIAHILALKAVNGSPAIVVIGNTGGKEAIGINSNALDDVNEMITEWLPRFGADINRIQTQGASRAGNTALAWGCHNPAYTVRKIISFVPPVKIGSMLRFSTSVFPALASVFTATLGSPDAWRYGYQGLTLDERARAACMPLVGTSAAASPEEADSRSVYGIVERADDAFLSQKEICISQGTHDAFMPMAYFVQFDSMLTARGITHGAVYGYGGYGHGFFPPVEFTRRRHYMPDALVNYGSGTVRGDFKLIDDAIIDTVITYRPDYFTSRPDVDSPDFLGFSATVPWRMVSGKPSEIVVMGEAGKSWRVWSRLIEGYQPRLECSGVFGQNETNCNQPGVIIENGGNWTIIRNIIGWTSSDKEYEWFFEYDGKRVPNRFTPFISKDGIAQKATFTLVPAEDASSTMYYNPHDLDGRINFGVDQFHPRLLSANQKPELIPVDHIIASGATTISFDLDVAGDESSVVYDLFFAGTRDRVWGANFNGLTGEFSYTGAHTGSYLLRGFAFDGLGGVDSVDISITVTGM